MENAHKRTHKICEQFQQVRRLGQVHEIQVRNPQFQNACRSGMRFHYRDAFSYLTVISLLCFTFLLFDFFPFLPHRLFPILYLLVFLSRFSTPPYLGDQTKPLSRFPLPSLPSPLYPSWPADSGEESDNLSIGIGCSIGILASLGNSLSLKHHRSELLTPSGSVSS